MARENGYKKGNKFPVNESYKQSSISNSGWISPIEKLEGNGQIVERIYFLGKPYRRYPSSSKFSDKSYFRRSPEKNAKSNNNGLHVHVWQYFNGKIPKSFHVHHKNGNYDDNFIENLEIHANSEHQKIHWRKDRVNKLVHSKTNIEIARIYASKWHGSKEGHKFHQRLAKISWKKRKKENRQCERCKELYWTWAGLSTKFCCLNCKMFMFRRRRGIQHRDRYRDVHSPQCHCI